MSLIIIAIGLRAIRRRRCNISIPREILGFVSVRKGTRIFQRPTHRDEISPCRVAAFFTSLSFVSALSVRVFNRNEWNKGFAFGFVTVLHRVLFNIFPAFVVAIGVHRDL